MHRLWYDIRSQTMFEPSLRATVTDLDRQLQAMIWRVVSRHAQLAGGRVAFSEDSAYSVFDGLFEGCLIRHTGGDQGAVARLVSDVPLVLHSVTAV